MAATSRSVGRARLQGVNGLAPFEHVVHQHGAMVLRICRAVLGAVDADDAWSETFLAALRAYPNLPADANVEAWLVRIAHRKAIDVTRAQGRRPQPVAQVPDRAEPGAVSTGARTEAVDLWRAVAELPRKQREVLAYHYLGGISYVEVAGIVGGSPDAARRAAADGIAALRERYADSERDADSKHSEGGAA